MNKQELIKRCRDLRKNETKAESILWRSLRNRRIKGLKFVRQHPFIYDSKNFELKYYIADFYCAEKKIVIELDGKIHLNQKEYDENRDLIIKSFGVKVVRFKNDEINEAIGFIKGL